MRAQESAVEHIDGVLAGISKPDRAHRVLHDGAQERTRSKALTRSVQGTDPADQIRDVEHHSPADHRREVLPGDLFPKVRSDQRVEPLKPACGIRCRHGRYGAGCRRRPARRLGPLRAFRCPGQIALPIAKRRPMSLTGVVDGCH